MLLLNKILPLFLLPPGVFILLAVAGLLFRKRVLVWCALALLWVLSMPWAGDGLLRAVEWPERHVTVASVRDADAIVVLGGMMRQFRGIPEGEWTDGVDRFEAGVALYRAGKASRLVFTRGRLPWQAEAVPEGELLARRAVRLGVSKRAILLTGIAGNTAEEAESTARLLGSGSGRPKRVILVTSAFHMRRAALLFRQAGFRVEPYPVDFRVSDLKRTTVLSFLPDAEAMDDSSLAIRELIGTGVYLARGLGGR
jgi:uncharacterized SAM-binding protein YcdF (DUF218 family)